MGGGALRRRAAFGLAALMAAALLSGCSTTPRPEGVVERWLLALNEGTAGRPEQYAPDALSQRVLPGWRTKDPGQLDTIEVGRGEDLELTGIHRSNHYAVPYRVVTVDGAEQRGTIVLTQQSLDGAWRTLAVEPPFPRLRLPSEGGPSVGTSSSSVWLISLGVAVALTLISMVLMHVVGKRPHSIPVATQPGEKDSADRKT